jgi:hypothetical protein
LAHLDQRIYKAIGLTAQIADPETTGQ